MTHWFFIALVGPVLWALVNHIDKYMLMKHLSSRGTHSLMIFSCLSAVFVLPVALWFRAEQIFNLDLISIIILLFCGFLSSAGFYFYLKAIDMEEVSIVIPLFQLLPVFSYFLAFFILGESLSLHQILASLLILLGAVVLSIEMDIDRSFNIKKKALLFVSVSSFSFALYDTLFKKVSGIDSFWTSSFWLYLGIFVSGLYLILRFENYRISLKEMIFPFKINFFSINLFSELLYILGNLATNYATLFAPVVLVLIVGSLQPVFAFLIAILMTLIIPKIITERISRGHVIHRLISILIILLGSYFLYISSY